MNQAKLDDALKAIGIDLSTLTPSQKGFLIKSTQNLLENHDLQWFQESSKGLQAQFDLIKNEL